MVEQPRAKLPRGQKPRELPPFVTTGIFSGLLSIFVAGSLVYFFFFSDTWRTFTLYQFVFGKSQPPNVCQTYERQGWNARPCEQYVVRPGTTVTIKVDLIFSRYYLADPPYNVTLRGCGPTFYEFGKAPADAMNLVACRRELHRSPSCPRRGKHHLHRPLCIREPEVR